MALRFGLLLPGLSRRPPDGPRRDFHIQEAARAALGIDDTYFTSRGDVSFPTLETSQRFAQLLNARRSLEQEPPLQASQVNAMGLLHEVFHAVMAAFRAEVAPQAFRSLRAHLSGQLGPALDGTLRRFVETFPPPAVFGGRATAASTWTAATPAPPIASWCWRS
jgi:hypothetical protein